MEKYNLLYKEFQSKIDLMGGNVISMALEKPVEPS